MLRLFSSIDSEVMFLFVPCSLLLIRRDNGMHDDEYPEFRLPSLGPAPDSSTDQDVSVSSLCEGRSVNGSRKAASVPSLTTWYVAILVD